MKMQKLSLKYNIIILLFFHFFLLFCMSSVAEATSNPLLDGIAKNSPTNIYREASSNSEVIRQYNCGQILKFRDFNENFYVAGINNNGQWETGYILKDDIDLVNSNQKALVGFAKLSSTPVYANPSKESIIKRNYTSGSFLQFRDFSTSWYAAKINDNGKWIDVYILKNDIELPTNNSVSLKGIATQKDTKVYSQPTLNSNVVRTYPQGSLLSFRTYSTEWYTAKVNKNNKWEDVYISKNSVELINESSNSVTAIALRDTTHVYSRASISSDIIRSYPVGSVLKMREFSKDFYTAKVWLNNSWRDVYINKNDVERVESTPKSVQGVANLVNTPVYDRASKKSTIVRTYPRGSVLNYKTFSSDFYIAKIWSNNNWRDVYIHKNDVNNATQNVLHLKGVALKQSTPVYPMASTGATPLRTYNQGVELSYHTFIDGWYKAKIWRNSKWEEVYINSADVETIDYDNIKTINGVTINQQTNIYHRASKSGPVVQKLESGTKLSYETYVNNWYKVTVGSTTGFIHADSIEPILTEQSSVEGYAKHNYVNIYSGTSRNSAVLRSYKKGSLLKFKTFSTNWYEAIIYINNKPVVGYIHHNDIDFNTIIDITYTNYPVTFERALEIQLNNSPKADGAGTIAAGKDFLAYYLNPNNFRQGEDSFYQFLVLSSPAGLNASEVNKNILNSNTGTLAGTASAFIEAGIRYGVNEAYLIAHALHETGNGSSQLAQGVVVNGRKVYNMYGTAAYDGTAVSSGAQYAYEQGWFTPEAAIIGGAEFVAKRYIHVGQDTLYKMKWNPENPGTHQYATHVAWATLQTNRISNIYKNLKSYYLKFDIPRYQGTTPSYQGPNPPKNVPESTVFPSGAIGVTTGSNARLRSTPTTATTNNIITTISSIGTSVELLSNNNQGWYQVRINNKTGWIHESLVKVTNVLKVNASSLNVRESPNANTNANRIGQLLQGTYVIGVKNDGRYVKEAEWYKIIYDGKEAWISSGPDHRYITIVE